MANEASDPRLAIIAAGILASGQFPIGPAALPKNPGDGLVIRNDPTSPDWDVYAEHLRTSALMKDHPGLKTVEALARDIHKRLYGA